MLYFVVAIPLLYRHLLLYRHSSLQIKINNFPKIISGARGLVCIFPPRYVLVADGNLEDNSSASQSSLPLRALYLYLSVVAGVVTLRTTPTAYRSTANPGNIYSISRIISGCFSQEIRCKKKNRRGIAVPK